MSDPSDNQPERENPRANAIREHYKDTSVIFTCKEAPYAVGVVFRKEDQDKMEAAIRYFCEIYKPQEPLDRLEFSGDYVGFLLPQTLIGLTEDGKQEHWTAPEAQYLLDTAGIGQIPYVQSQTIEELNKKLPNAHERSWVQKTIIDSYSNGLGYSPN